jgi:hypothetical protein
MKNLLPFRMQAGRVFVTGLAILLLGSTARGDVVFGWNELLLHLVARPTAVPAHIEVRVFAIAHLAMDEAIAAASKVNANADGRLAAQRAAVIAAARDTITQLVPGSTAACEELARRHLIAIPDGSDKERGMETGRAVAARLLAQRQHDGWMDVARIDSTEGLPPNNSESTALMLLRGEKAPPSPWASVTPFAIKGARQFHVAEVRTITRYGTAEPDLVLQRSRLFKSVDQAAAIASRDGWWSQKPVVAWNRIARQLGANCRIDLPGQARVLAVLNVALADATLSTLHWRHTIGGWRALTGEAWNTLDGAPARFSDTFVQVNGGWEPELAQQRAERVLIPPTPNYPSLPAAIAGAAQTALTRYFKADEMPFTLPSMKGFGDDAAQSRTFPSISAAARESAFVASLDGQHMREACVAGFSLGTAIGGYVSKRPHGIRPAVVSFP